MARNATAMNMGKGVGPNSGYSNYEQTMIDKLDYLTTE